MEYKVKNFDTDLILDESRKWLIKCFPDQKNQIKNLEKQAILKQINKLFFGGLSAFVKNLEKKL